MLITQKSQYALRALFELAKRYGGRPVKTARIAHAQAIPARFLGLILGQLRRAGFVESRRGQEGGYLLARPPARITVGEVLGSVEGTVGAVECTGLNGQDPCPLDGECVFMPMWERVREALAGVFDATTFADLVEQERARTERYVPCYSI